MLKEDHPAARVSIKATGIALLAAAGIMVPQSGLWISAAPHFLRSPGHALVEMSDALAQRSKSALPPVSSPLQTAWMRLINRPDLSRSEISAYAVNLTTQRVLASINPSTRVTPGSVTKLFTSAAALQTLGSGYRYTTRVLTSPATLQGDPGPIYLQGGGDPWLEANGHDDLEALAKIVSQKVHRATQVVGVGQAFSPPGYGLGWPLNSLQENYAAATSGLMAERSEVAVFVSGGSRIGAAPHISFKFNGPAKDPNFFTIEDRATTGGPASPDTITVSRLLGTNQVVVKGRVPEGHKEGPFVLSVSTPARFAAALFQTALAKDGVHFSQPAREATRIPSALAVLASHQSKPLTHLLALQNQFSINQMAENLYRATGRNGTLRSAASAIQSLDQRAGIEGKVQVDGSGLSPLDQMSAQDVVQLLSYASKQAWFPTFQSSLMHLNKPKGCGFLCPPPWHFHLPARTAVWVKTGNLGNQWNMVGYSRTQAGDLVAFAILDDGTPARINERPGSPVYQMMEDVADWPQVPILSGPPRTMESGTLPGAVKGLLDRFPQSISLAVVNVGTGQLLYQKNGQVLTRAGVAPRVILASAAIAHLPKTLPGVTLRATGPVQNGTLNGNLIIQSQDANLTSLQIHRLVRQIENAGIARFQGPIEYSAAVGNGAPLDVHRWPATLSWNEIGHAWAAPRSPLSVNLDQVPLTISARSPGKKAAIHVSPNGPGLSLINHVNTAPAGTPISLKLYPEFLAGSLVLQGTVPAGYQGSTRIASTHPGYLAAWALQEQLIAAGIKVSGTPTAMTGSATGRVIAKAPATSVVQLAHQSLTVSSILPSEMLTSALGPNLGGALKPSLNGVTSDVNDWTGASLENYLTAEGVAHALTVAYHTPADHPFVNWLSHQAFLGRAPEQEELMAYVRGPGTTVYGVVALASGLPWTGPKEAPSAGFTSK